MKNFSGKNLNGYKWGFCEVMKYIKKSKKGNLWLCKCVCGNEFIASAGKINEGRHKHCGCKYINPAYSHGLNGARIYRIWGAIKSRCYNEKLPSYKNYGGRGIKMCDEWKKDFINFYNDMKEGYDDSLSIDRIDYNGDYNKANCRWATLFEQSRNKRNNYWFEADGMKMIKMDWAAYLNVDHNRINEKLRHGYTFQQVYDFYKDRKFWKIKDQLNATKRNIV